MKELIEPLSSSDLLARAIQTFDELLPEGWDTSLAAANVDPYADRRAAPDALLEVEAPDGTTVAFAIAARLTFTGRDIGLVATNLQRWSEQHGVLPLVVGRFLSSTVRETLVGENISFVDACGNVNVVSPAPAIVLARPGLDRDPWRRTSTRDSLRGEPAARVVRTLCDFEVPMMISELIELSDTSAGATYRVLDLLFEEGLAKKGERGWVESVDRPALVRRWAVDWAAAESRFALRFECDDGLDAALKRLAKQPKGSYVLGGCHAAALAIDTPVSQIAVIHCEDAAGLARQLGARPAGRSTGADLIIHGRGLRSAAVGSTVVRKTVHAGPTQAYADLILSKDDATAEKMLRTF